MAILFLGLLLRVGITARDPRIVDRLFIPDDTYYTLSIARSLAENHLPAADGAYPTSGFQPLLAFLVAPMFVVSSDPDAPLIAALLLLSIVDIGTAFLLARLARRWFNETAALLAAASWSFSPIAISNALNGLETSLALCLQLAALLAWMRSRERPSAVQFALTGICCGLALLARVDSAFLVLGIGIAELAALRIRKVTTIALLAAAVVAPWWAYCAIHFGSVVPESGPAVVTLLESHKALYLTIPKQVAWAVGTVFGSPYADLKSLRHWLLIAPYWAFLLAALMLAGAAALALRILRNCEDKTPFLVLATHATAIVVLYSFFVPALWFFRRYLVVTGALATLLFAGFVSIPWLRSQDHPFRRLSALGTLWALIAIGASSSFVFLWHVPPGTVDQKFDGAKGYREVAKDVLAFVPAGSTVAALQSGALSYFAPAGITVVNLDGVVDRRAAQAFRERRLSDYAFERGVTHIADWRLNLREFMRMSSASRRASFSVEMKGWARPQGADRFFVGTVSWTEVAPVAQPGARP